ncbi:hypothetical protein HLH34_10840 [Gluconacetobacter azotocaptans]|uniref:Mercuric transport protein MerT n=2 Tax=Gluconacetobacter azotocaptans TaxID=142834 RepID=A0A7W4PDN9_9PROT|nr:hypothetical protein [Gluconacetobacter azotocaptans]MBM9400511.1 hypothetical protein [Gluconacetobacter azotocaptans]
MHASGNRAAGTVAVTASTAALACGVCCVLPFALPAVMLGAVGGMLSWFAQAYRWLTPLSVLAVTAGWLWIARQSYATRRIPARLTLALMGFATLMMVLALMWPHIEPRVIGLLRGAPRS